MGPSGISSGGVEVLSTFERLIKDKGLCADFLEHCEVHKVGCKGLCSNDVLVDVWIDDQKTTYQFVKPEMVERIVEEHLVNGKAVQEWIAGEEYSKFNAKQCKIVLADCGRVNPEDIDSYIRHGGYESLKKVLSSYTPNQVIDEIKRSGLRGRGGAGFPTGLKWEICRGVESDIRYIICNADEGDPGAFMDRAIIEGNPHAVVEGMIIGAYAIGSPKGYVYIRAEYPLAIERLTLALDQARQKGFVGKDILNSGFSFDIKIKQGAGAFVCGEETALIASIEGKRGTPRAKPPFPVYRGLWGKPTVINNVETLANVPYIIRNGSDWYASFGTEKSKGTKVFALTGKIVNSGLIEVQMGITLKEIIFDIGGGIAKGKAVKAVQTGGPSGGCIPTHMMDLSVDYESLASAGSIMGSGGMIVLDQDDCMVNVAKYFLTFTQNESCGKCVPCRIGTQKLLEILEKITDGRGQDSDIDLLLTLSNDIRLGSLCGLGQTAPNPVLSTLRYFRDEYETHIKEKRCPAKACLKLLTFSIAQDKCTGCGACLRACPTNAISGEKKKPHRIDNSLCIKCGNCFDVCKFNSVKKE